MPRVNPPPTPASSTDIVGESGSQLSALGMSFLLPPPAINAAEGQKIAPGIHQPQPIGTTAEFSLPPPPTRSRKIIQMKPRVKEAEIPATPQTPRPTSKGSTRRGANAGSPAAAVTTKKQPSATSVAGKKMARKTAHSVIERRRRSKMNEEFGVLKNLVPACQGQEMHKLAILQVRAKSASKPGTALIEGQASIDYLRYLEKCVADLQVANNFNGNPSALMLAERDVPPPLDPSFSPVDVDDDSESDEDLEMGNTESTSTTPAFSTIDTPMNPFKSPSSAQTSPALDPLGTRPASSYASSISTLPSPAYGPQHTLYQGPRPGYMHSASMSPILLPSTKDSDHEATSALLMLNKERRNPGSGRGMSVKDLLSH